MIPGLPLADYLARKPVTLKHGPIAVILCEDDAAIPETLRHHLARGFRLILALSPEPLTLPVGLVDSPELVNLIYDTRRPAAHVEAVDAVIAAVPEGTWLYYGFNAEFLFHPFCETRTVGELLAFHTEERRNAMLGYVIDLYAPDLQECPDAISLERAQFDRAGYFALGRPTADGRSFEERQLNFHGGLRWRFEEHIPTDRRRIDRICLFQAAAGLRVTADHRFNIQEYNTYSCRWHNNLTCAVASFRVAKALQRNPTSRCAVSSFMWRNSTPFAWNSQQLMDMGLMEPGQWF